MRLTKSSGGVTAARPSRRSGRQALRQADYEQLAQLRYLLRRFLAFSERVASVKGVTAQQHQAMLAIRGFGGSHPLSTGELAERLGIRHHSAVGLVDRLSARGLVQRKDGTADRRQVFVVLTPMAESLLWELSAVHRDELRRLAPLLRRLMTHFEQHPDELARDKSAH